MKILISLIFCIILMIIVEKKRGGDFDVSFGIGLAGLILFFIMLAKTAYEH